MRTQADIIYKNWIERIMTTGDEVETRNAPVFRHTSLPEAEFISLPIVTLRKTAYRKAISELNWFLSGNPKCPDNLMDWWRGQLNSDGKLLSGYGEQLNASCGAGGRLINQIADTVSSLKNHPFSRRHIITTWNPADMKYIAEENINPNTPTNCHLSFVQFFVDKKNRLSGNFYQRSADMLLGLPHNLIQAWALLEYFNFHASLNGVASMTYKVGDAHIYNHESHKEVVDAILETSIFYTTRANYQFSFDGAAIALDINTDFLSQPVSNVRPVIL